MFAETLLLTFKIPEETVMILKKKKKFLTSVHRFLELGVSSTFK